MSDLAGVLAVASLLAGLCAAGVTIQLWLSARAGRAVAEFEPLADDLTAVADAVREPAPEPPPVIDPSATRPYAYGGWIDVGSRKLHRSCVDARRDNRPGICTVCQPHLEMTR